MMLVPALIFQLTLAGSRPLPIREYPLVSERRLRLTREYAREHYGIDSHEMGEPKIIIIHYTAIPTLEGSLNYFSPDTIWKDRAYIRKFGKVNVGVHFLVDKNGDIWSLLPATVMGRHAIGFNHLSIGIENIAAGEGDLTEAQARSNARLVRLLTMRYPSIEFLAGHHEYTRGDLPHFALFRQMNGEYAPTVKTDPGKRFMGRLRALLNEYYGMVLKD